MSEYSCNVKVHHFLLFYNKVAFLLNPISMFSIKLFYFAYADTKPVGQRQSQGQNRVLNVEQNGVKDFSQPRQFVRNDPRAPRSEKPPRFQKENHTSRQFESSAPLRNRAPEKYNSPGPDLWTDDKNKNEKGFSRNDRLKDFPQPPSNYQNDSTFKKRENTMQSRTIKGPNHLETKDDTSTYSNNSNTESLNQKRGRREDQRPNYEFYMDRRPRTTNSDSFSSLPSEKSYSANVESSNYNSTLLKDNANDLLNGELELKGRRVGPIKPMGSNLSPANDERSKMFSYNFKKRSGPIKPERILEPTYPAFTWRPGDECLALYWEDNKVCLFYRNPSSNYMG